MDSHGHDTCEFSSSFFWCGASVHRTITSSRWDDDIELEVFSFLDRMRYNKERATFAWKRQNGQPVFIGTQVESSAQSKKHTHTRRVIVQPLLSKVKSFHRRQCEKSEREEDDVSPLCVGLDQTTTHKTTTGQVRFPIQMGWTSWYLRFTSHSAHCTPAAASSIRRVFAPHLVNE